MELIPSRRNTQHLPRHTTCSQPKYQTAANDPHFETASGDLYSHRMGQLGIRPASPPFSSNPPHLNCFSRSGHFPPRCFLQRFHRNFPYQVGDRQLSSPLPRYRHHPLLGSSTVEFGSSISVSSGTPNSRRKTHHRTSDATRLAWCRTRTYT